MVREDLLQGFGVEPSREPTEHDREYFLAKVIIVGEKNHPPENGAKGTLCKGLMKYVAN